MNKSFINLLKSANINLMPFLLIFLAVFTMKAYSQVGIGTQATINYPGVLQSEKYDIRFKTGTGYGFFARHDVYDSNSVNIDIRYNAVIMNHKANLPKGQKAKYDFSNFSIELLMKFYNKKRSSFYAGIGIGLLSLISEDRFRATYSDQNIYPVLFGGWAYKWAEGFDLFMELKTGYGETEAGPENIPVTGLAFNLGITMYLTE